MPTKALCCPQHTAISTHLDILTVFFSEYYRINHSLFFRSSRKHKLKMGETQQIFRKRNLMSNTVQRQKDFMPFEKNEETSKGLHRASLSPYCAWFTVLSATFLNTRGTFPSSQHRTLTPHILKTDPKRYVILHSLSA